MQPPLVTVIVPYMNPRRVLLAQKTINDIAKQNYRPLEVIVVNGTGNKIINNEKSYSEADPSIEFVEILTQPANAAVSRNSAIRAASGDWVLSADNDDWSHESRIEYQMARRQQGVPCLLRSQVRVDISGLWTNTLPGNSVTPAVMLADNPNGIPSTMLFPKRDTDGYLWLYNESKAKGEHEELLARMIKQEEKQPVVCDNRRNPIQGASAVASMLSVAFYHSLNELNQEEFFADCTSSNKSSSILPEGLNPTDGELLKAVLQGYNFTVA